MYWTRFMRFCLHFLAKPKVLARQGDLSLKRPPFCWRFRALSPRLVNIRYVIGPYFRFTDSP